MNTPQSPETAASAVAKASVAWMAFLVGIELKDVAVLASIVSFVAGTVLSIVLTIKAIAEMRRNLKERKP